MPTEYTLPQLVELTRHVRDGQRGGAMTVLLILTIAESAGAVSQKQMAGLLGLTAAGVVHAVDTAESLGLVIRHPHPRDRRKWTLRLSGRALELLRTVTPHLIIQ